MEKHKEYIERSDLKGATHLEISVYYSKGGSGYFSRGTLRRGYYLSVTPVTLGNRSVSFTILSGYSYLLLETKRYSPKQFAAAVEMAKEHKERLIDAVIEKNKSA